MRQLSKNKKASWADKTEDQMTLEEKKEWLESVKKAMIQNQVDNNKVQEKGVFADFCKKIKESFHKNIDKFEINSEVKTEIIDKKRLNDYNYVFKDFKINNWKSCNEKQLDNLVESISNGLKLYLLDRSVKNYSVLEDSVKIRNQNLDIDLMEEFKTDNACIYLTFSEIPHEISDKDNTFLEVAYTDFIFTTWIIFK